MAKENDRNCDITVKLASVLNELKNFEVAYGSPRTGRLILRFTNRDGIVDDFLLEVSPIYTEPSGKKDFKDIVSKHEHLIHSQI